MRKYRYRSYAVNVASMQANTENMGNKNYLSSKSGITW